MAKNPVAWLRLTEAEPLMRDLVASYHPHLDRARIAIVGRPEALVQKGKTLDAPAATVSHPTNALLEYAGQSFDYVITVALDVWGRLDTAQRSALLDHELCHAAGQNEAGRWHLRGHDVEEFAVIIQRHGLWKVDLELFAQAVTEQLPLPLGVSGR